MKNENKIYEVRYIDLKNSFILRRVMPKSREREGKRKKETETERDRKKKR